MKAQVTLFVVLGMVVMIIIGFSLFINDSIRNSKVTESADSIFRELEQSANLNAQMNICLKEITKNGLHLLGVQGGYIYKEQGGTQDKPSLTLSNVQEDLRGLRTEYELGYWIINESNEEYFSTPTIPKLCSKTGPNRIGISANSLNSCKLLTVFGEKGENIQDSLAAYINNSLPDCLNLEVYSSTRGNTIIPGNPLTEIIFDENSFLVITSYPFEIKIKNKEPILKQVNFTHEEKNRLQTSYNLLYLAANEESWNENFSIERDYQNSRFYSRGFIITKERDWNDQEDDLIWFKDENSLINGVPFTFMFAVQDRSEVSGIDPD